MKEFLFTILSISMAVLAIHQWIRICEERKCNPVIDLIGLLVIITVTTIGIISYSLALSNNLL
jgi:hypothetical protein